MILETTAEILRTRGIGEVTTNSIARHAAIPVSSIYQYFPDKVAILAALYREYLASIEEVMEELNTPQRLEQPWEDYLTQTIKAVSKQETRDEIDQQLDLGIALFPELMEIEKAHRKKVAGRLASTLRQLGSPWSTPKLERLALFIYELNAAAWRYRAQNKTVANELLDWETAAILATVGRCMES